MVMLDVQQHLLVLTALGVDQVITETVRLSVQQALFALFGVQAEHSRQLILKTYRY
jgi:hypothetical protein